MLFEPNKGAPIKKESVFVWIKVQSQPYNWHYLSLAWEAQKVANSGGWEVRGGDSVQANPISWEPQMWPYLEILLLTWNRVLAALHWALVLRGECGAAPPWWSAYHMLGPRFFPLTLEGRRRRRKRWREKEGKENRKERHRTHRGKHRKKALAWWGHRVKPCSSEPKQLPELTRG